jgi:hypothetical protein
VQAGKAKTAASRSQLPVQALRAAAFDTTKNPTLQAIWSEVVDYNRGWTHASRLSEAQKRARTVQLDAIFYWSVEYLMSKWAKDPAAQPDAKRVKRWAALEELLDAVTGEFEAMGMRRIVGTTKFREISNAKRNYWLERLDPRHRPGYFLSPMYAEWLQAKPTGNGGKPMPFVDWLSTPAAMYKMDSYDPGWVARNQSVEGYDELEPLFRKSVHFGTTDGRLKKPNDSLFTTQGRRTEFSGNGWAIWVCSTKIPGPTGQLGNHVFSYTHAAGDFHHSTFLGGAPVLAAGEWVVDNGVIRAITAKSGHYQPSPDNLLSFVRAFPQIPGNAIVRPDLLDRTRGDKKVFFYRVAEFRAMGLGATPLGRGQVLAALPPFANRDMNEVHRPPQKLIDMLPT